MARALWSGAIGFGLVNIPVKLYRATVDRSVRFHKLHAEDGVRLHMKMFCPADGKDVQDEDTARGYEVARDRYVVVSDDELATLEPKASRTIEVTDFVDLTDIDPIYFQRPYYLLPDEQASRSYSLLVEAMRDAGKVGIARFVMRNKEYLAALRPIGAVLCLETMHFADEVLLPDQLGEEVPTPAEPGKKEKEMAGKLIDMLAADFEPEQYHDDYREALRDLVDKKAAGEEIVTPAAVEEEGGKVIDLMAALEQSLQRAREGKGKAKPAGKRAAKQRAAK